MVTGAGSGIGRAIAAALASAGASVVCGDIDAVAVAETAALIGGVAAVVDVASAEGISTLLDTAHRTFGPVDIYVANAGIGGQSGLGDDEAAWDRIIETKRDILVRSLAAQAKLYRFLHKPESREPFLKARAKVLPNSPSGEAIAQWNYIQHYKPYATGLVMSEERFRYMQQLNVDLGVQSAVMPIARVADMSLAKEAIALFEKSEKK